MNEIETFAIPKWMAVLVPVLVALVTGVVSWAANRVIGKAAFQQAINTGFKSLVDSLREEHAECHRRLQVLEEKYEASRVRGAAERAQLRGEISNLTQIGLSLEKLLRDAGIPIPERHNAPPVLSMATDGDLGGDGIVLFQEEVESDDPRP